MSAMLLAEIAEASEDVAATPARLGKVARLADCLALASADEVAIAVAYLSGALPQGTVGVGWAALRELPPAADSPTLELLEVDAAVSRLQSIAGPGSQAARRSELDGLFSRATEPERRLLVGLFLGELRQGALEGVMADAVAKAAGVPGAAVRRAAMLAGDLPSVAAAAMRQGVDGLARFRLTPLQPITPMLAQTADDVAAALERFGARVSSGSSTARASRCIAQATRCASSRATSPTSPTGARDRRGVRRSHVRALVLDGEAIALRDDGAPQPFQVTMSRFGRTLDVAEMRAAAAVGVLLRLPASRRGRPDRRAGRRAASPRSTRALPPALLVPRIVTDDADGGGGVPRGRARARPRGRDGEVARRAVRGRPPRRRAGSRSSARTRSISSCSPRSGGTVAAAASCRISISGRAIRRRAAS